jgi:hypothetical protein
MKTLYHMATRGNLYSIALRQDTTGFEIVEYKHGRLQGVAYLGLVERENAVTEYNKRIDDSAKYDQIYYTKAVI